MKIIALTGGIGCGKTTAAEIFRDAGIPSVNADTLCHGLYSNPDSELTDRMTARWGRKILDSDGKPDRKILADIVFQDQKELDALSDMILPPAKQETIKKLEELRKQGAEFVLLDAPLLYEAEWDQMADFVIAVWAPDEIRKKRLLRDRQWDTGELERRKKCQISDMEKLERADYGLINSGSRESLSEQCLAVLEQIRKQTENNQ